MGTIVSVNLDRNGWKGDESFGPYGIVRTYEAPYKVTTEGRPYVNPVQVLLDDRLPQIGQTLAWDDYFDENVVVVNRQVQKIDPLQYIVTVSYGTAPSAMLTRESMSQEVIELVVYKDRDGKAIRNSADDWLNPPMVDQWYTGMLTLSQNRVGFNYTSDAEPYLNKLNSSSFRGYDPETCCLVGAPYTKQNQGALIYYQVDWKIAINRLGWKKQALDCGLRTKGQSGLTRLDDTVPRLLDGHGQLLPQNQAAVVLDFSTLYTTDFDALGLV